MFVGFIAVIVIILIIVTLMSTGATSGSGGVDQTKATKALGEISALGQSIGFYKTTTVDSDYDNVSVATLEAAGIIDTNDSVDSSETMYILDNLNIPASMINSVTGNELIKSKSIKGLYYHVSESNISKKEFIINTVIETSELDITVFGGPNGVDDNLVLALETSLNKLSSSTTVNIADSGDGLATITLK